MYGLNRYVCDVLAEMRTCMETRNFAILPSLIEETQTMANRMEMALADMNNVLISSMNSTMVHRNERDGVAWTKEIIVLKQIMYCTGIACKLGLNLLKIANPRRDNINRNLERSNGLIFAETAVNHLSSYYNKGDAKRIVSEGIKNVETTNSTLLVELKKITEKRVDYSEVFDLMKNLGQAPEIVEAFCDKVDHQNF